MFYELRRHEKMELDDEHPDSLRFAQLTKAAVRESQRWIEDVTGDRFKHHDNLIKSLQDGILLCRLANSLKAGSIKRINNMNTPVAYLDNLSIFQSACRNDFGLQEAQLFDIRDLDDLNIRGTLESEEEVERETCRRLRKVLVTLYWLGRAAQPLRPDVVLDLRTFEGLVDPSYFDITSAAPLQDADQLPKLLSPRAKAVDKRVATVGRSVEEGKLEWEMKFSEWKDRKAKTNGAILGQSTGAISLESRGVHAGHEEDQRQEMLFQNHSMASQQVRVPGKHCHEDFDEEGGEEAPAPPNWDTFPGIGGAFDPSDINFFEAEETNQYFSLNPDTSSSSSASSFATKDFGVSRAVPCRRLGPGADRYPVMSPTSAMMLSLSPETLKQDEFSCSFDGLLRDMEKFSNISTSQSLKYLEDFDEVGFDDRSTSSEGGPQPEEEESEGGRGVGGGRVTPLAKTNGRGDELLATKPERRPSDFLEELTSLDNATSKYDSGRLISSSDVSSDMLSPDAKVSLVVLQSPELLEKPRPASATMADVLQQNSVGHSSEDKSSRPDSSLGPIRSTMMDRFTHDLEEVLRVSLPPRMMGRGVFDMELERKRMEEWNKRAEEKLKDKFEKDQDVLKEKLKEDLRRAHQAERMKQLQEEKFLEEEVIEVKNRRSFAVEGTGAKFSKSSLSLFSPMQQKSRIHSKSPDLPSSFASLTEDWLSQSFQNEAEKPSFDDSPHETADSTLPAEGELDRLEDKVDPEVFEEPAWMKVVSERVDKVALSDVPMSAATVELLPDSLTTSSESLHSSAKVPSKEDISMLPEGESPGCTLPVVDEMSNAVTETKVSANKDDEAPPIPERDDSLFVTPDILMSKEQAAYLSFDSSISNFTKNLSKPPSSLELAPSPHHESVSVPATSDALLTPSSERCLEACRVLPPSPIFPHKRATMSSKGSLSSVFPSPRSPERPDYLCLQEDKSLASDGTQLRPVDFLFAYHNDQLKRRYYWATCDPPTNGVSPVELLSEPKLGSPVNRLEEKASCTGCGYCLDDTVSFPASEQTINIFVLKGRYHPECFKCAGCSAPLGADDVAVYQSVPHCLRCFEDLGRRSHLW